MGAYTRWTDEERATAARLVAEGNTCSRDIHHLFPGRSKQHVWNMMATAKKKAAGKCGCGGPMPPDSTQKHCEGCRQRGREYIARNKASGFCVRCGTNPADKTLTQCSRCFEKRRIEARAGKVVRPVANDFNWSGILRWRTGARPNAIIPHLLDESWTFVDLFGGSASISTAIGVSQPNRALVYNDIHPALCDIVETLRSGGLRDLVDMCQLFEHMTPEELLKRYRRRDEFPPLVRASLLMTLAQSVQDRDFFKMVVTEVSGVRPAYVSRVRAIVPTLSRMTVRNRDFAEVIKEFDGPRTLFFADPPFPGTQFYEHNLTVERFTELAEQLGRIRGRFFLLTNSTRASADACHPLKYNWWLRTHHGLTQNHMLVATNYVVELPVVDLSAYGCGKPAFDGDFTNRPETPRETASNPP
jgi:site-specific DNA-adenine methylase